jgi:hypothetical protein
MTTQTNENEFTGKPLLDVTYLAALGGAADVSLEEEIAVLEGAMARALAADVDPVKALQLLSRGVAQLATVMRAKRALPGEATEDLTGAFAEALGELLREFGIEPAGS